MVGEEAIRPPPVRRISLAGGQQTAPHPTGQRAQKGKKRGSANRTEPRRKGSDGMKRCLENEHALRCNCGSGEGSWSRGWLKPKMPPPSCPPAQIRASLCATIGRSPNTENTENTNGTENCGISPRRDGRPAQFAAVGAWKPFRRWMHRNSSNRRPRSSTNPNFSHKL